MYPSIFNTFPVIRTASAKKLPFSRTAAHIFVSPGDAPVAITQYAAWMERQFNACQTPRPRIMYHLSSTVSQLFELQVQKIAIFSYRRAHFCFPCDYNAICCMGGKTIQCSPKPSQHIPIYLKQFPSYSNRKCKKSPFSCTTAHVFVSPGDAAATITQYAAWMERQFNACQTPRSMYLSIFNSFRVIRCLSQCVTPKIAIFTTFLFPLGMPLGQSR